MGMLFAVEAQALLESGREDELEELREAYELSEDAAEEIVQLVCKKYVSQLQNLALRASKLYNEEEAVKWTKEILKYARFFEGSVDADAMLFDEEDKERLISFMESDASSAEEGLSATDHESANRLRDLIRLTPSFKAPQGGIDGLLKTGPAPPPIKISDAKKKWAWN